MTLSCQRPLNLLRVLTRPGYSLYKVANRRQEASESMPDSDERRGTMSTKKPIGRGAKRPSTAEPMKSVAEAEFTEG
jgi:hypothetical protein